MAAPGLWQQERNKIFVRLSVYLEPVEEGDIIICSCESECVSGKNSICLELMNSMCLLFTSFCQCSKQNNHFLLLTKFITN